MTPQEASAERIRISQAQDAWLREHGGLPKDYAFRGGAAPVRLGFLDRNPWLRPVIGAASVAAPVGLAGAFGGGAASGIAAGGAGTAGTTVGSTVPALTVGGTNAAVSGIAGAGSLGGIMRGAGRFFNGNAGLNAVNQGVGALTNYYSARTQGQAADRAAELEAQAARETLAFLKEQEATRQREFAETQAKNEALFREREARLAPYRRMGAGTLGQLARPIPRGGSLGSLMGGR